MSLPTKFVPASRDEVGEKSGLEELDADSYEAPPQSGGEEDTDDPATSDGADGFPVSGSQ